MHFNSDFFIRRAFYSRLAHLFATTLGREMSEVKRSPPALCVRQETQCRADKKCSCIVNLWGGPLPGLMGPKTGHGSPRSEILATPLGGVRELGFVFFILFFKLHFINTYTLTIPTVVSVVGPTEYRQPSKGSRNNRIPTVQLLHKQ